MPDPLQPPEKAVEAAHAVHRGTAGIRLSPQGVRKMLAAALPAINADLRERVLSKEVVQVAAEKADEPYEWARESPQEFIKKVLEVALDAATKGEHDG